MIGVIVTGHANFATGITSSLELITGKHEQYSAIDFDGVISPDQLLELIKTELENLKDCEHIYIFTDLLGGTPFRMAATATLEHSNLTVFAGTNLPMLIECMMSRQYQDDAVAYANQLMESSRTQLSLYEPVVREVDEEEDGI